MTRPGELPLRRKLWRSRQALFDAFRRLTAGEVLAELPFTSGGVAFVARDVRPFDPDMVARDFYLAAWCLCQLGRRSQRGPRVALLGWKDTGDPYLLATLTRSDPLATNTTRITCPSRYVFGVVFGGVTRADGALVVAPLPATKSPAAEVVLPSPCERRPE